MKEKELAKILSQEQIAPDIYSMWLAVSFADQAKAGQFVSLYTADNSRLLPRPISICQIDKEQGALRLVYRIAGEGTRQFSTLKAGDEIAVIGPLGNGFPVDELTGKKVMLMGGGIGIPPMVETGHALKDSCQVLTVAGYRDLQFLTEELTGNGQLYIATEDGSFGTRGNVLNAVEAEKLTADVILACGPTPMLRAIKAYAQEHNIICYVSMEEKMACGIGACLACVCKTKEVDHHSHVNNRRICKDGPVFLASEVEL